MQEGPNSLQMHFLITFSDHPSIINHNMCITQMSIIKSFLKPSKRQPYIWIPANTEHVQRPYNMANQCRGKKLNVVIKRIYTKETTFTWRESNTVASLDHLMLQQFSHSLLLCLPQKRSSQGSKSALHQPMLLPFVQLKSQRLIMTNKVHKI